MTHVTSGSWRYLSNPIAVLARMYHDTQDLVYKHHADRLWNTLCFPDKNIWWVDDHGSRMVLWYAPLNPQCMELWTKWTLNPEFKDRFNTVDVLTRRFLDTSDIAYAQAASKLLPEKRSITLIQHLLAGLRASCYAGESLAATPHAVAPAVEGQPQHVTED